MQRTFPPHFHSHYLLGCLLSGDKFMRCGQKELRIKPGQLVAINPGLPHSCNSSCGDDGEWFCMHISPAYMRGLHGLVPALPARISFSKIIYECPDMVGEFLAITDAWGKNQVQSLAKLGNLLRKLVFLESTRRQSGKKERESAAVQSICRFLKNNCLEQITLDDVPECARLGKFRMIRLFSGICGITPYRYLEAVRLDAARSLLKNGCSPLQAAMDTGFYDQSHFNKCFKNTMGLTPGQFRASCLSGHGSHEHL